MSERPGSEIAIIGVAGCYAGARDARAFWRNILGKVDAVAPATAEWTGPYLDAQSDRKDRIYTNRGGFLRDLAEFNPVEFGIMPSVVDGAEPDHYLALRLARDALADAGYAKGGYDPERAGVILGRGTYINRGYTTLMQHGMVLEQTLDAVRAVRPDLREEELEQLRQALRAQLPAFNAEMCPGLVPNVTSGLIANRLNLMGPNFIIDAACASSLISMELAIRELQSGRCEMVLCGGVQAHTPPQLFMIFCQIGALSREQVRPFQRGSSGTLLGEGAGILVLKRLSDAEAAGDRIYAVIKGVGSSSDGRAKGLLAPRLEGEVLALRRAYAAADVDPATVGLVEAHGTGIALGDRTEIESLTEVFGARRRGAALTAIGSVKSMISHCIPAAGSASLIKMALALHHKVLPPTLCDEVNPELQMERTPFYVNTETRPWVQGGNTPRRAGVNAFGFGGVNAHVVLEEYRPRARGSVALQWHAPQQELFVFAADDAQDLCRQLQAVRENLETQPGFSLARLAAQQAQSCQGSLRFACVADDAASLSKRLGDALTRLQRGETRFNTRSGLFAGTGAAPGKLALLFPGEGAQYSGMLQELALAFPTVREWFDFLDGTAQGRDYRAAQALFPPPTACTTEEQGRHEAALLEMDLASESVFTASQALWALYQALGLQPQAMLGHSTGENTALVVSGRLRTGGREGLSRIAQEFNAIYRRLSDEGRIAEGRLLTVGAASAALREKVLESLAPRVVVAMDNCPNQFVLFGAQQDIAQAHEELTAGGAICAELPFGRAYHTALFEPVSRAFREIYAGLELSDVSVPLYSCASADVFPSQPDAIRDLACAQWSQPVRFRETIERLYADGYRVFLEVGPSANLTSFVEDILGERDDCLAISSNSRRQPDTRHFLSAVAQLWTAGIALDLRALYAHRELPQADHRPDPAAPRLRLELPAFKVPPNLLPPPPASVAVPAAVADVSPPVATSAVDPRVQALQGHFALMQEFLASQARVLAAATQGQPPPVVAATSGFRPAEYPLLGTVTEHSARRLVAERRYSLETDVFLRDHALGAAPSEHDPSLLPLPVVPFTFSMEITAEAALRLAGAGQQFRALEGCRGHRWLSLDEGHLDLRIVAEREETAGRIGVRLYQKAAGAPEGGVLVYEATVVLAESPAVVSPAPMAWDTRHPAFPALKNPDGELYAHGMFHGPRLQGVKRLLRWSEDAIEAELEVLPSQNYFSFTDAPAWQFDAALLDAAGQLAGYWLSERHGWGFNCFPFRVARYTQYLPTPPAASRVLCRGRLRLVGEQQLEASFDLIDTQGRLIARAEGWEDRLFQVPPRFYDYRLDPQAGELSEPWLRSQGGRGLELRQVPAFADGFLEEGWGIWKRALAHMVLSQAERTRFHALPVQGPRREEWLLGRIAAKEAARAWIAREHGLRLANADVELIEDAQGKPRLQVPALQGRPVPAISLAHSQRHAVAVAGAADSALGVDYQRIERVNVDDLITGAMTDAEGRTLAAAPAAERRQLAVAIWCAKEAAAKACGTGLQGRPRDWEVTVLQPERGRDTSQARVRHQGQTFDVTLYFESSNEVAALCQLGLAPQRATA